MPQLRIDEDLWKQAHSVRKHEWRVLIADLARDETFWPSRRADTLILGRDEKVLRLTFISEEGERTIVEVQRSEISRELSEYLAVMERLGEDGLSSMRAEALDMAKRVVHDDAARRLAALLPEMSQSLESGRRFFTLVVSIIVDTTGKHTGHLVR